MAIRKVILSVVGHVDHGKTSLLDKIRRTVVAAGEAGAITQAIGVSIVPMETIKKICGSLLDVFKGNLTVPGFLTIDTPGHAAFTSLRQRGGSLADIAILVVDLNEGCKPQTIESINILKQNKVPFIIAANKVDLLQGWQYDKNKSLLQNITTASQQTQALLDTKLYELVGQLHEAAQLQADRFDRVQDYTQQLAIVPLSAHTGQGIPELLMVITGLAQKYLEKRLHIQEAGPAQGSILEVKETKGLGTTVDVLLYNGTLKVNDTIVIGGINEPITTKVRALLEPNPLSDIRDKKSKFKQMKEVTAATGVKIAAPNLENAMAGMPIKGATKDTLKDVEQEVQTQITSLLDEEEEEGVIIKADTIGSLEALKMLLKEKDVPIAAAGLGDISKKDLAHAIALKEKDDKYGAILGFNIALPNDLEAKEITVITHDVIYQVIDDYEAFLEKIRKKVEEEEFSKLTRPCKFLVMEGYVFRQSNPAIVGVDIDIGQVKTGDGVMNTAGQRISRVKSLKEGKDAVSQAHQGQQLAMGLEGVTIGRQVKENDLLYTDINEEEFSKLKKLKKYLTPKELDVLKEIVDIKRSKNPVWGVS